MKSNLGYYDHSHIEESSSEMNYFVHGCGHYQVGPGELYDTNRPHGTRHYHLLYLAGGEGDFFFHDHFVTLHGGDFLLYEPGRKQHYIYQKHQTTDVYWLHFSCNASDPFLNQMGFVIQQIRTVGIHNSLTALLEQIIRKLQIKDMYFIEETALLLQELLLKMSRQMSRDNGSFPVVDMEIRQAICDFHDMAEQSFCIKTYAADHQMNYYRFIDRFSKYTGVSPRQYIIQIRMDKAKGLLRNTTFPVSDIANHVGYENPLYFSRLFRQHTNMSPTDYRSSTSLP